MFAGMLGVTHFELVLTPVFYVALCKLAAEPLAKRQSTPAAGGAGNA